MLNTTELASSAKLNKDENSHASSTCLSGRQVRPLKINFVRMQCMNSIIISCCIIISGCISNTYKSTFRITDFGARGNGKTLNTASIQKTLDKVHSLGGGTVIIPKGIFVSGSIFIKSNTILRFEPGAVLLGSSDINDYKELTWGHNKDRQPYHLVIIDSAENVRIEGPGIIDGNGETFWQDYEKDAQGNMVAPRWIMAKEKKVSPLIEVVNSRDIRVKDIHIKTGGGWNLHFHNCERIVVDGIQIVNNLYSPNSDGIDITGCSDVIISNCYIKTCDDAICLKTTPDSKECRRVTVTNCIIETLCVGLKMGCNESFKDMSDVTFSNCVVNKSSRAVGLYVREGAHYENIVIDNIVANTNAPLIFNRPIQIMVERRDSSSPLGSIKNVSISNFICKTEGRILLTAEEGAIVENIFLHNITLDYPYIEDPQPFLSGSGSAQFPKLWKHPESPGARAAVVAENIRNLIISHLQINWPEDSVPEEWRHVERIENGTKRIHVIQYDQPRKADFSVLWGKNLSGGYIYCPLAQASSENSKKYVLHNSTIKITENK